MEDFLYVCVSHILLEQLNIICGRTDFSKKFLGEVLTENGLELILSLALIISAPVDEWCGCFGDAARKAL